ncbi:hypothetical protein M959_07870, partial [Chaetura pelagica]
RANVCCTREFLVRGRLSSQDTSRRHCQADIESYAHIIGYCPKVQDARIKRHNNICDLLIEEDKTKDWIVFQEPNLRVDNNNPLKPDSIFVKGKQALVIVVTIRYESNLPSLSEADTEKVQKYQHLTQQIQDLTNSASVNYVGFPMGTRGKWYLGNYDISSEIRLSKSCQFKVA